MINVDACVHRYVARFERAKIEAWKKAEDQASLVKEIVWPTSFPNCTPKLRTSILSPISRMVDVVHR